MPKIIVREIDNTTSGVTATSNFTVVVPGFASKTPAENCKFKIEDGIFEFETQKDFENTIGLVSSISKDSVIKNDGNQMAYELLGLGYTVIYLVITDCSELNYEAFWGRLKDRSVYNFRYVTTGGYCSKDAYEWVCKLATHNKSESIDTTTSTGRGDCTALIDIDESNFKTSGMTDAVIEDIINEANSYEHADKYTAICCPQVIYDKNDLGKQEVYDNTTLPTTFHYLACAAYARNELSCNEWYAPAGYERGISKYRVVGTTLNLGEIAVNALQPRKQITAGSGSTTVKKSVNIVKKVRNNYYFWGNRTAHELETGETAGLRASHFLNIRQLCSTLKKDIYDACARFTFDPNSDILWGKFCNAIKPTLERMKADQGIADYKITKIKSTKKAILAAKVRIVPIEAVEDFDISVYLEDSLAGISIDADEE